MWSEHDDEMLKTVLWHLSNSISNGESTDIKCDTTEWIKSIKKRMMVEHKDKPMTKKQEIECARTFFDQVQECVEDLDDTTYEFIDPDGKFGDALYDKLNNQTVKEVLSLGFRAKYGADWHAGDADEEDPADAVAHVIWRIAEGLGREAGSDRGWLKKTSKDEILSWLEHNILERLRAVLGLIKRQENAE